MARLTLQLGAALWCRSRHHAADDVPRRHWRSRALRAAAAVRSGAGHGRLRDPRTPLARSRRPVR